MRLRLTTKQVNGGYYKGNRTGSMGVLDKKGQYRSQVEKHRNYIPAAKLELPGLPEGSSTKEPFLVSVQCSSALPRSPADVTEAHSLCHKTHATNTFKLCARPRKKWQDSHCYSRIRGRRLFEHVGRHS
jgi:hypothetical protein